MTVDRFTCSRHEETLCPSANEAMTSKPPCRVPHHRSTRGTTETSRGRHRMVWAMLTLLLLFTGHVAAEWEEINADAPDDDVNFIASSSKPSKVAKKNAVSTFAKKTYQSSPTVDPVTQFTGLSISTISPAKRHHPRKDATKTASPPTPAHTFRQRPKKQDSHERPTSTSTATSSKQKEEKKVGHHQTVPKKSVASAPKVGQPTEKKDTTKMKKEEKKEKKEEKEYKTLKFEEFNMEGENEVDCDDELNSNDFDCIYPRTEALTDDSNMSNAGDREKQKLMTFMDLGHRVRRQVQEDLGSGAGSTYPDDQTVTDGQYTLTKPIVFENSNFTGTPAQAEASLLKQLGNAFKGMDGYQGVKVNNVKIVDGKVTADWTLTVSGKGIGAFGANKLDLENALLFKLLNDTQPKYDVITIGDAKPTEPFNPSEVANNLANDLDDICSANPCGNEFDSCVATGYDQGVCLHKCKIFEDQTPCEHGGQCVLVQDATSGNTKASCDCTTNWKGSTCQERDAIKMTPTKITGVTIGAAIAVVGACGMCCWLLVIRRRRRPVNMTYFGDDSSSSEGFSSPSSKIGTFVIDRPRVRSAPIRSFSPHNYDDFSRPSSASSRPREPARL